MSLFDDFTVAELRGFRKELGKAIASGAMRVRFADRDVTYRSLDDMRRAGKLLDDKIAALGGTVRNRQARVNSQKGFS